MGQGGAGRRQSTRGRQDCKAEPHGGQNRAWPASSHPLSLYLRCRLCPGRGKLKVCLCLGQHWHKVTYPGTRVQGHLPRNMGTGSHTQEHGHRVTFPGTRVQGHIPGNTALYHNNKRVRFIGQTAGTVSSSSSGQETNIATYAWKGS